MNTVDILKEIINLSGLSANEISSKTGIQKSRFSQWVSESRIPKLDILHKIAKDLGYSINMNITKNGEKELKLTYDENDNLFLYNDDHFFLNGSLPHIKKRLEGGFLLDIKKNKTTIFTSNNNNLHDFINSELSIENYVEGNLNTGSRKFAKFFGSRILFNQKEYLSFINMLEIFKGHYFKKLEEFKEFYGIVGFERIDNQSSYFLICYIPEFEWNLIKSLSRYYDLDSPNNDFFKFNHIEHSPNIMIYNPENSLTAENTFSVEFKKLKQEGSLIHIGWRLEIDNGRNVEYIKKGTFLNAKQTKDFIIQKLIPKAKDMFNEGKFNNKKSIFNFFD
ncbi:Helix-turn-helix domain-containing protein [Tenacibaculum sp. MAR_2009_124]|uniref:helix-turn-helix domain-containing protein n=1 Tax=Tenacibaculum sp. MAR_2009_124 TaxID=1250059 RepID=UPI0008989721|nr:helix-turn-helix transcriptional regulator [Tenacibaculum sp. MAR_2009_124]SED10353.1 Helix-turn-helix domain-containing protein [Tenacibaculum sp. MAR_2009_124]